MRQMKICMLGAFGVGKTSLVQRFVKSIFSEKYHSTLGVKVDKKEFQVDAQKVMMMLWDIHGEEAYKKVSMSYLRGASGYLLVADGTRKETLETALSLQKRVVDTVGDVPFLSVLNKYDLIDDWEIDPKGEFSFAGKNQAVICSSALSGEGVEEAFEVLARRVMERL